MLTGATSGVGGWVWALAQGAQAPAAPGGGGGSMSLAIWAGFVALVLVILFVDLFVVSRGSHEIPPRRALGLTAVFATLGILFSAVVYVVYDRGLMGAGAMTYSGAPMTGLAAWQEYVSVWVLEYSMSVDNLFVFTLVFTHFAVPPKYQHRVLFWGIMGALIFRGLMIGLGAGLVGRFEPVLIVFGLILLWTAFKMLKSGEEDFDPSKSLALRVARLFFPVTDRLHGERFFVRASEIAPAEAEAGHPVGVSAQQLVKTGALYATPLFLVLCVVEATDILFAVDSVPVALGQSKEPFIIFSANVFAILGLRALYFAISSLIHAFRYLKPALAIILIFIGIKMILTPKLAFIKTGVDASGASQHWQGLHIDTEWSLGVIGACLVGGVVLSLLVPEKAKAEGGGGAH
jgi:tellurite resistance protein TerC